MDRTCSATGREVALLYLPAVSKVTIQVTPKYLEILIVLSTAGSELPVCASYLELHGVNTRDSEYSSLCGVTSQV